MNDTRDNFELHIHGLETFAKFVAIIRGQDLDPEQLRELTARLKQSNDAGQQAIDVAKETT